MEEREPSRADIMKKVQSQIFALAKENNLRMIEFMEILNSCKAHGELIHVEHEVKRLIMSGITPKGAQQVQQEAESVVQAGQEPADAGGVPETKDEEDPKPSDSQSA